jgi:hypothetical protein
MNQAMGDKPEDSVIVGCSLILLVSLSSEPDSGNLKVSRIRSFARRHGGIYLHIYDRCKRYENTKRKHHPKQWEVMSSIRWLDDFAIVEQSINNVKVAHAPLTSVLDRDYTNLAPLE